MISNHLRMKSSKELLTVWLRVLPGLHLLRIQNLGRFLEGNNDSRILFPRLVCQNP